MTFLFQGCRSSWKSVFNSISSRSCITGVDCESSLKQRGYSAICHAFCNSTGYFKEVNPLQQVQRANGFRERIWEQSKFQSHPSKSRNGLWRFWTRRLPPLTKPRPTLSATSPTPANCSKAASTTSSPTPRRIGRKSVGGVCDIVAWESPPKSRLNTNSGRILRLVQVRDYRIEKFKDVHRKSLRRSFAILQTSGLLYPPNVGSLVTE